MSAPLQNGLETACFFAHSSPNAALAPPQRLDEHLQNVAELAARFAAPFGASALACAAGLLHDLGKYCLPFQRRLDGAALRVNHSTWGAKVALERYGPAGWLLAYGVAGHHAGLANGAGNGRLRMTLADRLADRQLPALDDAWQREIHLPAPADLLAEIGQLRPGASSSAGFSLSFLARMVFSTLVDADRIDTERYYGQFSPEDHHKAAARARPMPTLPELREALNAHLQALQAHGGKSEINRIRTAILAYARQQAACAPGLFSLTVPTGGGKTLASLAFALDHAIAHGLRRVIFVIPFTSIVEQNAAVFRKALGPWGEQAVLEHHSAFTPPDAPKGDADLYQAQAKLRLAMENWDAPIVVTTAVQFFESLFADRPAQCRKLHNIAGSVVVLDEAQTIPLPVLRPAVAAIDELARNYRTSVVLCTATQPALQAPQFRGGLQNVRPLVQDEHALARQLERVRVRHVGELDDTALAAHLRSREQVLCIVNNRRHARAVFQAIADAPGAMHLSTLMCARHRSQALATARQRLQAGQPCRIVSTSLIEAGVDISLPTVLRAEAGLDSIAQAAGRCNRNKEWPVEHSEVLIFANSQWPPPPDLKQFAQATKTTLAQPPYRQAPLSPEAIRAYFEHMYWKKGEQALDEHGVLDMLKGSRPDNLPLEDVAQHFRLIQDSQQPVIVAWDDAARKTIEALRHAEHIGSLARALQPYLVQTPRNAWRKLRDAGAIQPIAPERWGEQFMELVNPDLYSAQFGLWWDEPTFVSAASLVI